MIAAVCNADALQYGLYPLVTLCGRYLLIKERQHDVFRDGQFVDKIEALEYEADVLFANLGQLAWR